MFILSYSVHSSRFIYAVSILSWLFEGEFLFKNHRINESRKPQHIFSKPTVLEQMKVVSCHAYDEMQQMFVE